MKETSLLLIYLSIHPSIHTYAYVTDIFYIPSQGHCLKLWGTEPHKDSLYCGLSYVPRNAVEQSDTDWLLLPVTLVFILLNTNVGNAPTSFDGRDLPITVYF